MCQCEYLRNENTTLNNKQWKSMQLSSDSKVMNNLMKLAKVQVPMLAITQMVIKYQW